MQLGEQYPVIDGQLSLKPKGKVERLVAMLAETLGSDTQSV
ncbi:hypothetical protein [Acinetobacter sp. CE-15]